MRRLLMALVFSFSLGCMGAFNSMTGLDLDMQIGESSVHPADFAVQPLPDEKMLSMGMTANADSINLPEGVDVDLSTMDKVRMDLITYKVADVAKASEKAAGELKAAGYTLQSSNDPSVQVYANDGMLFVLALAEDGGEQTLSLIRLEPLPDEPGEAAN